MCRIPSAALAVCEAAQELLGRNWVARVCWLQFWAFFGTSRLSLPRFQSILPMGADESAMRSWIAFAALQAGRPADWSIRFF